MSVRFVSAILGPETAAPILWTPGKNAFFLQEKPVSIKVLVLGGGGILGFGGGGGKCRFYFYGREDFSDSSSAKWWVLVADDLGFLGPGIPDLVTELCPPQDSAQKLRKVIDKKA